MKKDLILIVLAAMEAYRLQHEHDNDGVDFPVRICEAILAGAAKYDGRGEWVKAIKAAGLIDYGWDSDPKEQYKALIERISAD